LNLEAIGVKVAANGKIIATDDDKTTVDNIYAIGDVCHGRI
jgi:thioredoxin reductase (NADPH)